MLTANNKKSVYWHMVASYLLSLFIHIAQQPHHIDDNNQQRDNSLQTCLKQSNTMP